MKLFSPAKINLFFRVLKKQESGFHEIASLMQAISLGDILRIEKGHLDQLTTSDPDLPCDERNLIHQALRLYREKTGYSEPIRIHVEKRIPMEGGLGGGSGNVATTLWALNQLSGIGIKEDRLRKWAGEISSDAPFFFSSGTAYTEGRGEVVTSLDPFPSQIIWIAKPQGKGLSTPWVYEHCRPNFHNIDPQEMLQNNLYLNDLEFPAFKLRPDLAKLKEDLLNLGFEKVGMTGSGTAFFCFGLINPKLEGVHFFKTTFLSRQPHEWYTA